MRQRVAKGALVALVLGLMFAAGRGTAHLKQAYQAMTVQGVIEDEADNWGWDLVRRARNPPEMFRQRN